MKWMTRSIRVVAVLVVAFAMTLIGAGSVAAQDVPAPPVVGPDFIVPDMKGLPADSGMGRRVVFSVGQQRVWWVEENGLVSNTYLVSGKANTPELGTYHVFSKSRHTTSLDGGARMEFMVRFTWGNSAAIGFHSIPVNRRGQLLQGEDALGTPQSAGCVRQRWGDAAALYDWAQVGTQVVVVK
jgi:lipoprotein-anchoring transpeptidase ErfK/SrfK